MSEKKNHNPHGCILLCDDNAIVSRRRCLRTVTMCFYDSQQTEVLGQKTRLHICIMRGLYRES